VTVSRFTPDFLSYLAAADLSISMGGYNTCMNILASGVKALVWPYPGDREQGLRARRLQAIGAVTVLEETDLQADRLAAIIRRRIGAGRRLSQTIDLGGAARTAAWLQASLTG
jgi:predicted glycosyltransferase